MSRRSPLALLLAAALVVTTFTTSYGAGRADLIVTAVSAPAEVEAGAVLAVKVTTRNAGRSRAGASVTKVYLSRDTRPGKDVATGSVRVPRLAPGRNHTATVRLNVPAGAAARSYRLLACADVAARVREAKEGNNCRLARSSVRVVPGGSGIPDFPLTPDPVAATGIELEPDRAVTRTVDPEEAASRTITATGSDGTTYRLMFPAESLLTPEEITMTPLSDADLPLLSRGFIAGVRLEPEGLMLQAPATLTIASPDAGPVAEQTAYVFHEEGEDFHPYPPAKPATGDGPNTVRLQLSHFSAAGVGGGTDADRAALAAHPPARHAAQAEAAIAEIARQARESNDPSLLTQAIPVLENYYDDVLDARLAAAEANAALAAGASAEALSFLRQLALLGEEDHPLRARILERLRAIWTNAMDHYWDRCVQAHDLTAIPALLGIARQVGLLLDEDLGQRAFDRAVRCGRFEVAYDSTIDYRRDYRDTPDDRRQDDTHYQVRSTTVTTVVSPGVSELAWVGAEGWSLTEHFGDPYTWIRREIVGTSPGAITAAVEARANPIDPGPGGIPAPPVPYVRLDPGVGIDGVDARPVEHNVTNSDSWSDHRSDSRSWHTLLGLLHDWAEWPRIEIDLEHGTGSDVLLDRTIDQSVGGVQEQFGLTVGHTVVRVTHTPDAG